MEAFWTPWTSRDGGSAWVVASTEAERASARWKYTPHKRLASPPAAGGVTSFRLGWTDVILVGLVITTAMNLVLALTR